MAANIKKDELLINQRNGERNPIAVRQAAGMATFEPAFQRMQSQVRCKRVFLQVGNSALEALFKIRMTLKKSPSLPQKTFRSNDAVH